VILNGSDVEGWNDQSGNGRSMVQGDTAQQPAFQAAGFNGNKTIQFDGVDEILAFSGDMTGISGDDLPHTVIWAGALVSTAIDQHMWSFASATVVLDFHGYRTNTNNAHSIRRISTQQNGEDNTADTGNHVFSQVFTGTTVSMFEDGVVVENLNGEPMDTDPVVVNRFSVGGKHGTSEGDFCNCLVSEVIIYDSALSDVNRGIVEAALTARWGL